MTPPVTCLFFQGAAKASKSKLRPTIQVLKKPKSVVISSAQEWPQKRMKERPPAIVFYLSQLSTSSLIEALEFGTLLDCLKTNNNKRLRFNLASGAILT